MPQLTFENAPEAAAKAAMRVHMRALRRNFIREHPEADWEAGDRAAEMLIALGAKRPGVCAVYHPSGAEMDARPLAEALSGLGWKLALPWCEAPDAPVVFRAWTPGDRLAPDAVGIASPLPSQPAVTPDLVICPLLAFDAHGYRLGQGGGYYDRTLEKLRAGEHKPVVVGLAFSFQEVESVAHEAHDQKIDAILTEKGYRRLA
jgi:5-formyltetrahydrofolate cyclo-ligase